MDEKQELQEQQEQGTSRIIPVNLEKEMKDSFLDYSMSVIISRARPDVRDGLKPVHRRILYTMYENTLWPEKAYSGHRVKTYNEKSNLLCTGFRPSRTTGRARENMTDME